MSDVGDSMLLRATVNIGVRYALNGGRFTRNRIEGDGDSCIGPALANLVESKSSPVVRRFLGEKSPQRNFAPSRRENNRAMVAVGFQVAALSMRIGHDRACDECFTFVTLDQV